MHEGNDRSLSLPALMPAWTQARSRDPSVSGLQGEMPHRF